MGVVVGVAGFVCFVVEEEGIAIVARFGIGCLFRWKT